MLFCDAIYLPTRPSGANEGVLVAWGYDETGRRMQLDVVLGQRERFDDWLEMGRGLVRRGLRAPMLVVTEGASGLIEAMEELWPRRLVTDLERPYPSVTGASPRICRPSARTSSTRCDSAGGSAPPTCWSGRWRK